MARTTDQFADSKQTTPVRRIALASCAGTTIEFYDFYIYGTAAALVFPTVFFSALGATAGALASFMTFAVAFVARPMGAIIFGHFGDRLGRKRTLIATLLLMGGSTVLVGLVPPSATIGVAAPIALVVLRIAQGLAVGGEWAGAALMAIENAPARKRGLYGIFPQLGASLALILSSGTFLVVNQFVGETSDAFMTWGWRIPFIASGLLVVLGLYVRLKVGETPMFERQSASRAERPTIKNSPLISVFWKQTRELVIAAGALSMMYAFFYVGTAFLSLYGTSALGLSRATVLSTGIIAAVFFCAATALSGIYSDRIGRRKIVLAACGLSVPWALVLFALLDTGTGTAYTLGLIGTLTIAGISLGPSGALLPEMFATRYRYTGAGMAYALAAVIGGGLAPIFATTLVESNGSGAIGWMLAAYGALSLLCCLVLPETRHRRMEDTGTEQEATEPQLQPDPA